MKKLALVVLAFALVAAALLSACGSDKVPAGAIAKVGSGVVTKAAFDQNMAQAKNSANQPGSPPFPSPGTPQYNQYAGQLVDYLVTQEVIAQEAKKLKIDVTDKAIEDRLQQLYQAYGGQKKVEDIMKKQNMTLDQLKQLLKNQILGQSVYDAVTKNATANDKALQDYYNAHKTEFNTPETRTARHILVKSKATADKVAALLRANPSDANWKKLAKQYSTDKTTAANGGDLGNPFPQGQMVPPFDKAAFAAKKGVILGPVKTKFGWHVIEVTGITPAKSLTFEEAKSQIQSQLSTQLKEKAWQDWLTKAKKDAHIKYAPGFDPAQLTANPSPAPSQAPVETSPSASASGK